LSACVRRGGELGWVVGCSFGGESWDGEEEEEIEKERVGTMCIYGLFTDGISNGHVVLEYPSVILTENEPRHCTEIPV